MKVTRRSFLASTPLIVPVTTGLFAATAEAADSAKGTWRGYRSVKIGSQVWMAQNLKVTTYRDGERIPEVRNNDQWSFLTYGAQCSFDNDAKNSAVYGRLYNFYAVTDPRGLAPVGWRIPEERDWAILTAHLGGDAVAGSKLKEQGTARWASSTDGASSGFNMVGNGYRNCDNGTFVNLKHCSCCWSSTQGLGADRHRAYHRHFIAGSAACECIPDWLTSGFSVRCIKA